MTFLVLGEALVDLVQSRGDGTFSAHPGGSPYNVAITVGRLGGPVGFVGQCGDDAFGEALTARLAHAGVSLGGWRRLHRPSSLAVAALDPQARAEYRFYFDGTAGLAFPDAVDLDGVRVLHTGSIASWIAVSAPAVRRAMRRARGCGALVSYDPNVRPDLMADAAATRVAIEACVSLAHVVKASEDDLAALYPRDAAPDVAAGWCRLGAGLVVVTRGADGAVAFGPAGRLLDCSAPGIAVADTVGAGDAFTGGLLCALAQAGLDGPDALLAAVRSGDGRLATAVRTAVAVSAITCERPGADPPTAAELAAWLAPPDRARWR